MNLWSNVISPHLLKHLIIESGKKGRFRPHQVFNLIGVVAIIALAGPTYQKEASPFAEDKASLVIVVKVTPSMLAQDIQPSRLARAAHKIKDLLSLRPGTKTALIAYAGSAHVVLPLTADTEIISTFAAELEPIIMPKKGDALEDALDLAEKLLKQEGSAGTIVLMADGVMDGQINAISEKDYSYAVQLYTVAGAPGVQVPVDSPPVVPYDDQQFRSLSKSLEGTVVTMTVDNKDLQILNSKIESSISASLKDGGERWLDMGYWLVPLLVLFALMWFRKGWELSYE
ncbi:MAG: VWA domain-containing protein [Lentisphaeraceae bacterium]|nr:VWA domain-containing protein [Lentisphaeraceae bacterium]